MKNKEAQSVHELHPLLKKRWSPRAFDGKMIENEKLLRILEAARWSPSASNHQPWAFVVGKKGSQTWQDIFDTLIEFNRMWAVHAPVLILNCGITTAQEPPVQNACWQYDLGQAVAHMSIQAMHEEVYVHQMAGFDPEKAAGLMDLPGNYKAFTVTAMGYLGDPGILHPRMQKTETAARERKEMDTFVSCGPFGKGSLLSC
jgi:nitroreductase